MKIEILSERQNSFMKRKELQVAVDHGNEPTPSRAALQGLLAKQSGEPAEKIDVRTIYSDRGRSRSLSKVFVWEEPPKKKEEKKGEDKQEQKTEPKEKSKEKKEGTKAEEKA